MTDVFFDGRYFGKVKDPKKFVESLREKRRKGLLSNQLNVAYLEHFDIVMVSTDSGRARRPLIVVENGKPKLTKEHINALETGKMKWSDLVNQGIIEYLDATEEENALIALRPEDLTTKHTHLELDPTIIMGVATSLVPFAEFDRGDRVNFGGKMIGQAIGIYSLNYPVRVDTKANIMIYPQVPLIKTHMNDIINDKDHPGGHNVVIALMSFLGYNMEDAVVINKSSIERGLFWSYMFRTYEAEEKRYLGGQEDIIGIPEPGIRGYAGEDAYKHLPEDGIVNPETIVKKDDILIGKSSPLRFLGSLDQFTTGLENIRETSVKLKHSNEGIVDRVFITESYEGNKLVKVVVRDLKIPELGDKFASRHGQKGVLGLIINQEDLPFTEEGIVPDIIFNPHGIPSRMTIGQLLEIISAKVAAITGEILYSPAFHPLNEKQIRETLKKYGYDDDGKETMFDGRNGEKLMNKILIGSVYYQKLDHLVSNKMYSRSKGPVTLLTKQPTEGKSKMGGLRLGEMEKDCLIAHGASLLLKERFDSDKISIPICKDCGVEAINDRVKNKKFCPMCGGSKIVDIDMSYAFKLLLDELKSMVIYPKVVVDEELSIIDKIIFGVLTPEMIKKISASKISKTELYDQEGYPIEGGLMDPRLGVIDPGLRCRTCGGTVGECKGHFGHLELTKPVIHVNYAKLIYNILRFTCRNCGKVLITPEDAEKFKSGKKSLKKLKTLIKTTCPYCNEKQRKIKYIKPTTYQEDNDILDPVQVRERLEKIPDTELSTYLGIKGTRPEYFVLTLLPIPPVTVRPSITLETGERSEDDLTHKLVDIVRINKRLRENIDLGAPEFIIQDLWELLQYHVATYMNNEISGVPPARHRSGRVLKTLAQRLKTKEGRFRSNLIGKRVNYSARTVISPDPFLDINEVGVPLSVAKELTVPVVVNERNIEKIKQMIERYPEWPTINYVNRPDGRRKKVTELNKADIIKELEPGYVVEKQIEDGDWSVFNRQPSLHRMSMMGHRVRVMPWNTLRLNLSVAPPYNADFDGDEMNLHIPQTKEAQVETKLLTEVSTQFRSPRFSSVIIGAINDHITGLYLLTTKMKFSRKDAVSIVKACDSSVEIPNKKEFDGKELFSLFLPKDFNFEYTKGETKIVIKNGQLEGFIDESGVGAFKGKILDEIEKVYGGEYARKFLFNITKLSLEVLTRYGFTVSVSDYDVDPKVIEKINKLLDDAKDDVNNLIKDFKKGKIKGIVGKTPRETFESVVKIKLADLLNEITSIVSKSIQENSVYIMAKSGARGSLVNMVQCIACLGQETLKGERIKIGYYKRTLPHFERGDISLESKGFVRHGYKTGLTPFEFFFDAMNSREGLMDKSLKTRHSGYLERRLIGALKDLKVEYDGTVRDASKKIIQFVPAEDGLDPSRIQKGGIDVGKIAERLFG
ncbi:MAG: DNA-directed RNA polymerase subunit A' [Candidatus Aenigmatarchaeota archaeon]